jgi:uncharacterized protein YjbJ (UPF0337 family)
MHFTGVTHVKGGTQVHLLHDESRRGASMSGIDKMKNKAEELQGKGKEAVGDATDDRDLQAEGKADQASGNLKQAGEKVKDVFK